MKLQEELYIKDMKHYFKLLDLDIKNHRQEIASAEKLIKLSKEAIAYKLERKRLARLGLNKAIKLFTAKG